MGYIVDLIIVLIFLSEIHQFPETVLHGIEEDAVDAIRAYISSRILSETHKEIRKFVTANKWRETINKEDVVRKEIVRLVQKFHPRARHSAKEASRTLPSPAVSSLLCYLSQWTVWFYQRSR